MSETPSETNRHFSSPSVTLRQEWLVIVICSAAGIAIGLFDCLTNPAAYRRERTTLLSILGTLVWWFGHALWLTMDRRRRGLEVGRWRYGVIFFGPFAIWLYLILEYRARALYLIPLSVAIYLAISAVYAGVMAIAVHS
jgi:hypothetical protein